MENFELIKKHSGWFVIPFTWIAYYIDFGTSHIRDKTLESAAFLSSAFVSGAKTVATIILVALIIMLLLEALHFLSARVRSNIPYLVVATLMLCFGVVGLFKEMEIIPFKEINLFWHFGTLAGGIWLFGFLDKLADRETLDTD